MAAVLTPSKTEILGDSVQVYASTWVTVLLLEYGIQKIEHPVSP